VAVTLALGQGTASARAAAIMTAASLGVVAVLVGPFGRAAARDSLVKNTIPVPAPGLASVDVAGRQPRLPGQPDRAEPGNAGRLVSSSRCSSWVGVARARVPGSCGRPRTVPSAAIHPARHLALSVMFVLAPATRFGYFHLPGWHPQRG